MDNVNPGILNKKGTVEITVITMEVKTEIKAGYRFFLPPKSILNPALL